MRIRPIDGKSIDSPAGFMAADPSAQGVQRTYFDSIYNAKSNTFVAASIISNSNGALSQTHSDVRMTGRPFWELTSPASGTWTTIVPQAEGSGK